MSGIFSWLLFYYKFLMVKQYSCHRKEVMVNLFCALLRRKLNRCKYEKLCCEQHVKKTCAPGGDTLTMDFRCYQRLLKHSCMELYRII